MIRGKSWSFRPEGPKFVHKWRDRYEASVDQNILILTCFLFIPSLHLVPVNKKISRFRFL